MRTSPRIKERGHSSSQGRSTQELGTMSEATIVSKEMQVKQSWNYSNPKTEKQSVEGEISMKDLCVLSHKVESKKLEDMLWRQQT